MCRVLRATGDTLAWAGEAATVDFNLGSTCWAAAVSSEVVVLCSGPYCQPLRISGGSTSAGQRVTIPAMQGNQNDAGRFSRIWDDRVVYCYNRGSPMHCRLIRVQDGELVLGDVAMPPVDIVSWQGAMQEFGHGRVLWCYHTHNEPKGMECRFLTVPVHEEVIRTR